MADLIHALAGMPGMIAVHPDFVEIQTRSRYSRSQRDELMATLPNGTMPEKLRSARCILLPTPPDPYNLLDVIKFSSDVISKASCERFNSPYERFARDEYLKPATWIAVKSTPFKVAKMREWSEQLDLMPSGMYVPLAVASVYAKVMHWYHSDYMYSFAHANRTSSGFGSEGVVVGPLRNYNLLITKEPHKAKTSTLLLDLAMTLD